jgi:hypothetical protein
MTILKYRVAGNDLEINKCYYIGSILDNKGNYVNGMLGKLKEIKEKTSILSNAGGLREVMGQIKTYIFEKANIDGETISHSYFQEHECSTSTGGKRKHRKHTKKARKSRGRSRKHRS